MGIFGQYRLGDRRPIRKKARPMLYRLHAYFIKARGYAELKKTV
jgi:hypothetical protein